jgi:hypothetical protein
MALPAGFALVTSFWPLLLIALVGTLNPSSGDVSVFLPLEHAVLSPWRPIATHGGVRALQPGGIARRRRGRAGGGLPGVAVPNRRSALRPRCRRCSCSTPCSRWPPRWSTRACPPRRKPSARHAPAPLTRSKARVYTLAALFGVDAFAGGLIAQSMIALWLYQRHGLESRRGRGDLLLHQLLSAISFILAVRIAGRIGLVNTMVFTHLPANACLVAIPFVDSPGRGGSRCCWSAGCCRRWTCRRAAPT